MVGLGVLVLVIVGAGVALAYLDSRIGSEGDDE